MKLINVCPFCGCEHAVEVKINEQVYSERDHRGHEEYEYQLIPYLKVTEPFSKPSHPLPPPRHPR